jgi:hypothetical protein
LNAADAITLISAIRFSDVVAGTLEEYPSGAAPDPRKGKPASGE